LTEVAHGGFHLGFPSSLQLRKILALAQPGHSASSSCNTVCRKITHGTWHPYLENLQSNGRAVVRQTTLVLWCVFRAAGQLDVENPSTAKYQK
jgi:hypothetical protein